MRQFKGLLAYLSCLLILSLGMMPVGGEALTILNRFEHGPLFTPPSEKGTINLPGWGGDGKDVGPLGGGGNVLRAFDKKPGKVIAEIDLEASPHGTPMTCQAGGKQYIVIATIDNRLAALALP